MDEKTLLVIFTCIYLLGLLWVIACVIISKKEEKKEFIHIAHKYALTAGLCVAVLVFSMAAQQCSRGDTDHDTASDTASDTVDSVYICTGPDARRYHFDEDCDGLFNCTGAIEKVAIEEAEDMGRTPCKLCTPQ